MEFHYKFATTAAAVYCNYSRRRRHIATCHHGDDHHEEQQQQQQQRGNGATIKCDELGVSSMDELSSVPLGVEQLLCLASAELSQSSHESEAHIFHLLELFLFFLLLLCLFPD